jgi:hypothetical protein
MRYVESTGGEVKGTLEDGHKIIALVGLLLNGNSLNEAAP